MQETAIAGVEEKIESLVAVWNEVCNGLPEVETDALQQTQDFELLDEPKDPASQLMYDESLAAVTKARKLVSTMKLKALFDVAIPLRELRIQMERQAEALSDMAYRKKRNLERIAIDRVDSFRVRLTKCRSRLARIMRIVEAGYT